MSHLYWKYEENFNISIIDRCNIPRIKYIKFLIEFSNEYGDRIVWLEKISVVYPENTPTFDKNIIEKLH